jgi:heme/copper-type cytochrome/quinol oxidase subunit 2
MEVANTSSTTNPVNMYNYLNSYMLNPTVFIIIFLTIVAYFVFSSSLGNSEDVIYSEGGNSVMTFIIVAILVILIAINAFQYFFSINITAYVKGLLTPNAEVEIVVDQNNYQPSPVPEIKIRKQVFNVPGNYYTYDSAKALCKAYGSNLATYQQVENSYENGGEWCNYGWSEGQMA